MKRNVYTGADWTMKEVWYGNEDGWDRSGSKRSGSATRTSSE